ncbi:hypothetical protein ABVK25_002908 [Lepraria finkii]|uniref:Uncharacterized protein n=1 Tax=Lepraria finkii TaxID=1340010 RepID=A0ABR4BFC3_9LECA
MISVKRAGRSLRNTVTDGACPPESLKYPINLSNVEALYGKDAGKVAAAKVTFDAIEVTHVAGQAPVARLVQKVVALSGDEEVVTIPKDTAATAAAQIEK